MSQAKLKMHKLTIKSKAPGEISVGANTQILLDDKPLKGVKFLKIEFHSRKVTKVQIEMFVDLDNIEVFPNLENYDTEMVSERWMIEKYRSKKEEKK